MERYRSGHNEAVLKTVCPQGRVGSNPTLSACWKADGDGGFGRGRFYIKIMNLKRFECWFRHLEKYPRWLKGHPWKGCRSLIAARGFKSLLLRSFNRVERWTLKKSSKSSWQTKLLMINSISCLRDRNESSSANTSNKKNSTLTNKQ